MADKIKIRAGTGLQTTLQSTVNFAQAFTELAKNSLQNGATYCDIDIVNAETETYIKVTDDGRGFDHVRDEEYDLNDFEKYFTFGTSFDLDKDGDAQNSVKWESEEKLVTINYQLRVNLIGNFIPRIFTENAL